MRHQLQSGKAMKILKVSRWHQLLGEALKGFELADGNVWEKLSHFCGTTSSLFFLLKSLVYSILTTNRIKTQTSTMPCSHFLTLEGMEGHHTKTN